VHSSQVERAGSGEQHARLGTPAGERSGEEANREGHELPASQRMAEWSGPNRVGHGPPLEYARTRGSLAEVEGLNPGKSQPNLLGVRASTD